MSELGLWGIHGINRIIPQLWQLNPASPGNPVNASSDNVQDSLRNQDMSVKPKGSDEKDKRPHNF